MLASPEPTQVSQSVGRVVVSNSEQKETSMDTLIARSSNVTVEVGRNQ